MSYMMRTYANSAGRSDREEYLETRLDRLARSVPDLHAISQELQVKGVDLIATEQNIDTTTPTGRL
ncbi:MAG TPA: integrase, partial [Agrobacterium sp.]|nr:integrase [Agrobacterium sp.]